MNKLAIFHLTGAPRTSISTYPTLKKDFDYQRHKLVIVSP